MPEKDITLSTLTESQVWLAEQAPSGFLVALWLDPETAGKLAIPGGEPADNLHLTLAYCGDASSMSELDQTLAIASVYEEVRYWSPITGTLAGYGRFTKAEDDKDVFYASPDIPELPTFRQCLVRCLQEKGVSVSSNHGYIPHITLSYLEKDAPLPDNPVDELDFKFTGVTVMSGTRRTDIPFWVSSYPEATISMSDGVDEIPLSAPLDARPTRALFFGDFNKEWIPFLPKPGHYLHPSGDLNLAPEVYTEMLRNFDAYVFKQDLPIRATHMPADGGAIGWIRPGCMRLAGDGSLEVKPEWNELGKGLVDGDRFRYVSAEFCRLWTNPVTQETVKNLAVGLALVPRPHFKTDVLNPLSASEALAFAEAGYTEESGDAGKDVEMTPEELAAKKLADDAAEKTRLDAEEATKLSQTATLKPADQQIVLSDLTTIVVTAQERQRERQMFADLNTRVELAERRAESAESQLKNLQHDRLVEKYTAEVTGRSAGNGMAWFGDIESNVKHLVSLAEAHGETSTEVSWAVNQKRTEAQAIENTGIFKPLALSQVDASASVDSQITFLADQILQKQPSLSRDEAIVQAYQSNPNLYARSIRRA